MDLAALEEALDGLALEPRPLGADVEALVALERCLARLSCLVDGAAAAFERERGFEPDGARSASAWLSVRARLPQRVAKAQLRRGRALCELPVAEASYAAGAIGPDHVGALAGLLREPTHDAVVSHEGVLVEAAEGLSYPQFTQALAYFAQLADPNGTEEAAGAQRARRDVYLVQGYNGAYLGGITLDPIAGAIVAGELARLERALFDADRAKATALLERTPLVGELERTGAQRRADALVEMARRSAACDDEGRFPAPLVSVLVGYETLHGRICELANGTVVSPGSLLSYLDEAMVERAVFKGQARVEVGAATRLFSGATRRAVELRDRVCQHPYCEVRAERCEVDHIVPAAAGGPTTQENGRLLCGFHNRLRNTVPELPELPPPPGREPPGRPADRPPDSAPGKPPGG